MQVIMVKFKMGVGELELRQLVLDELEVIIVQDGGWGVGVKVAGVGVVRGERAGCDHGEVHVGGQGVGDEGKETMNIEELFFKLNATRLK